jgi:hypothetical protein
VHTGSEGGEVARAEPKKRVKMFARQNIFAPKYFRAKMFARQNPERKGESKGKTCDYRKVDNVNFLN